MLKRILVGLGGGQCAPSAVKAGLELAQSQQAELTGLAVLDLESLEDVGPVPLGGGAAAHELREKRLEQGRDELNAGVAAFERQCAEAGVPYRLIHAEGDPIEHFISASRYQDLVVTGLKRVFEFGPADEPPDSLIRLIGGGVRPILAVDEHYHPVKRVVIAYSGSMESAKNMKRFVELRLWPDAHLQLVTFQTSHEKGDALLKDAADYCRSHGFSPEVEVVSGSPRDNLLPYADACSADLVVVGNSAKNLLMRRIFGETALYAMRNSKRPLFLGQ